VRISLVHNPTAGEGLDVDDVVQLLTDAGHDVRHRSSKGHWQKLLQDPGDLVVAAGGDGTVRKVALAAAEREVPFAALPIGTANNIAKTLGLVGDAHELVRAWGERGPTPIDIGEVRAGGGEPTRFLEGVGGGWVADLLVRAEEVEDEFKLLGRETDRALHMLADLLDEARPARWQITADEADLSGDYLAVEILNTRFIGPNVPLAPDADASDGSLDVVLVTDADREGIGAYVEQRRTLASGLMPALRTVRAREISTAVPARVRVHVDDVVWPDTRDLDAPLELEVRCLSGVARMVG
jgi:diacylglycerol kinase family enzyme